MAIGSNYHAKEQQTKVISTKVSVDQHDRFNSLCKYLNKRKGVGESPTPSAILRHNIDYLLRRYENEMEGEYCNDSNNLVDDNISRSPVTSPMPEDPNNHSEQSSTSATAASAVQVPYDETKTEPKEMINIQKDQNEVKSQLDEKQLITVLVDPKKMNTADRILIARSDRFVIMIVVDVKTAKVESVGLAARKLA
jgi:hypothetical protein